MQINGTEYVVGHCRNDQTNSLVAHLYRGIFQDSGEPMCVRGWNRSGGDGYSIFWGDFHVGAGLCKVCLKRAEAGKEPVPSRPRKTRWI